MKSGERTHGKYIRVCDYQKGMKNQTQRMVGAIYLGGKTDKTLIRLLLIPLGSSCIWYVILFEENKMGIYLNISLFNAHRNRF